MLNGSMQRHKQCGITGCNQYRALEVRRKEAMLKYWARPIYNPHNPTRKACRDPITQASNSHIENTPNSCHSATWTTHDLAKKTRNKRRRCTQKKYTHRGNWKI
ncbi:hypothetical protein PoB_001981200 [Plakobranchus ocellatus]|uniref:Uncharacterized protein n=1 Tax=Plakobranchus ocellatus TaxID=259542 RepID=A0AAV3ZFK4_9GAST|nr:hypothetical protein PoB_001981200 [Plakobranchus ocellatus]